MITESSRFLPSQKLADGRADIGSAFSWRMLPVWYNTRQEAQCLRYSGYRTLARLLPDWDGRQQSANNHPVVTAEAPLGALPADRTLRPRGRLVLARCK